MKTNHGLLVAISTLITVFSASAAEQQLTGRQLAASHLESKETRDNLDDIRKRIGPVLADKRLADAATREMLERSQAVLTEMIEQRNPANAHELVALAKWMQTQSKEAAAIQEAGGPANPEQEWIVAHQLKEGAEGLAGILRGLFSDHVWTDGTTTEPAILESCLQLYLDFRQSLEEGGTGIPDFLLLKAPEWMKERYLKLSPENQRRALKDIQDARKSRTLPPVDDGSVAGEPPSPQEQAAYEAAYEWIVKNTPAP
jgi:hypothetical protein